jgi:hypothetical protein
MAKEISPALWRWVSMALRIPSPVGTAEGAEGPHFRAGPKFKCAPVDRIEYPTLFIANP